MYSQNKRCERCDCPIPDDYQNLLCDVHYIVYGEEQKGLAEERAKQAAEDLLKNPESPAHPEKVSAEAPIIGEQEPQKEGPKDDVVQTNSACNHNNCGIQDPDYKENPEADDKDQVLANIAQFIYTHRSKDHPKGRKRGVLLYYPQRNMYNYVKNYCMKKAMSHPQYPKYLWKPKIVDVGCGSGVGANIMSQEADFVWGIDKNEMSIEFAQEAFTREKNGEYYSSQLTFDVIDLAGDTRQFMAFDIVTAIEIVEHVWDVNGFLNQLKRFAKKTKNGEVIKEQPTEFFISTPNRNNQKIRKDRPENPFHVREWTSQEYKALLQKHFERVELMNDKGEPVGDDCADQVVFAKCSTAIL